jgi:hypothetical protein
LKLGNLKKHFTSIFHYGAKRLWLTDIFESFFEFKTTWSTWTLFLGTALAQTKYSVGTLGCAPKKISSSKILTY